MIASHKRGDHFGASKDRNVVLILLMMSVPQVVIFVLLHPEGKQENIHVQYQQKSECLPNHNIAELLQENEKSFRGKYREEWAKLATEVRSSEDGTPILKRGAEVGVFKGQFAKEMLATVSSIEEYILVDPWKHLDDWNKPFNKEDDEFEKIFKQAMKVTRNNTDYGHKVTVIRKPSLAGTQEVADNSLDFVYIDGDHTAKGCLKDVLAWVPKVKCGGLVFGDDYADMFQHGEDYDPTMVKSIVDGYAETLGVKVYEMGCENWAFVKPRSGGIATA